MKDITFEGLTADEVVALEDSDFDALVFSEEAIVIRVGTASILGRFSCTDSSLVLELAQIDGGGEGVLPSVAALAARIARKRGLSSVEWRVHAIHCVAPNEKLRRILVRRGFEIRTMPGVGDVYHRIDPL